MREKMRLTFECSEEELLAQLLPVRFRLLDVSSSIRVHSSARLETVCSEDDEEFLDGGL